MTERNLIFENNNAIVESAKLKLENTENTDFPVAIKSLRRIEFENLKFFFENEIITYHILKRESKNIHNEEERIKLNYFVDYVGFMMSDKEDDPFFGSIITKYYSLGNLSKYTRINENDENTKPKEISQLVDFAIQIATGLRFIQKYIFKHTI